MELASFGWRGGRDGWLDMAEKWCSSSTWTFTRTLRESPPRTRTGEHAFPAIAMKLTVYGRGPSCRAYRWLAMVTLGEVSRVAAEGTCRSVREAQRDAKGIATLDDTVLQLLRTAYSPHRAKCIYRRDGEDWLPWMTFFGFDWHVGCWDWPRGEYLEVEWSHQLDRLITGYVRTGCGSLIYGRSPDTPQLESWLPLPAASMEAA